MARRVFISFLGTNNYLQTYYKYGDKLSKPVRFVQEALIGFLCEGWTEEDKILIFVTGGEDGSDKRNWQDGGQPRPVENPELENKGLKTCLDELHLKPSIEAVQISEGFSESDIWSIFDAVYEKLDENDEIYFDVTHAFRSIPMFSIALFNYARFMKNTSVNSILYGAFEKLGPVYSVKEIPLEERVAPVVDLTNVVRLQQYTEMASSLKSFGRINKISDALRNSDSSQNQIIQQLYQSVDMFDDYIQANRKRDIKEGRYIISINNSTKAIRKLHLPSPIIDIINELGNMINEFGFKPKDDNDNIEAAIKWAVKYEMLTQAYTMGEEYIIDLITYEFRGCNPYKGNYDGLSFRRFIGSILSISEEDAENDNFRSPLYEYRYVAQELLDKEKIKLLRPCYKQLTRYRNQLNHGMGNASYDEMAEPFNDIFNKCLSIIKNAD